MAVYRSHPSEYDPPMLVLYRRLFALVKTAPSESTLIREVVDGLQDFFDVERVSLSKLNKQGIAEVQYCRQGKEGSLPIGSLFDTSCVPRFQENMWAGRIVVTEDIREFEGQQGFNELMKRGANPSRVDIPFSISDSYLYFLSLTKKQPGPWGHSILDSVKEVGELVSFLMAELKTRNNLIRSQTVFRQFSENVKLVFWLSDPEKNSILYVSPAYEEIWGRPLEELYMRPRSFIDAIHPEDRERVSAAVARQVHGGYEEVYRVERPGGDIRWVKDRGFIVRDEAGLVHRIAGIAEDITPLIEAEERVKESQAMLASNAKFAALGEMASGVAHEINNPLAVIHGRSMQLLEMFRQHPHDDPQVEEGLESIQKMSNRIAAIVKGLRTFSRKNPDDPLLEADLKQIVQDTMELMYARIRQVGAQMELPFPEEKMAVFCRPSEISQVILNLLSNACDAVSEAKERRLEIKMERRADVVLLSFQDSGPGIPVANRDKIFQPFFTTKEVGKGTGLGLSISKGIVEANGGRIYLDANASKTKFIVELRAVKR